MAIKTTTVPARGIGKPDYTRDVSSAIQRAGIRLKFGETLGALGYVATDQVAHPYPVTWVKPPIAPGATVSMLNPETGLPTFTVPAGYTLAVIQEAWTQNQDIEAWFYFDGALMACYLTGKSGMLAIYELLLPFDTALIDPTGAASHTIDMRLVNVGSADLEGSNDLLLMLTKVGTPPLPPTKDCRCPLCGHIQTVPRQTVYITCEKCSKLYIVKDFSGIRKI